MSDYTLTCPRCRNRVGDCTATALRYTDTEGDYAVATRDVQVVDLDRIACAECGLDETNASVEELDAIYTQLHEEDSDA